MFYPGVSKEILEKYPEYFADYEGAYQGNRVTCRDCIHFNNRHNKCKIIDNLFSDYSIIIRGDNNICFKFNPFINPKKEVFCYNDYIDFLKNHFYRTIEGVRDHITDRHNYVTVNGKKYYIKFTDYMYLTFIKDDTIYHDGYWQQGNRKGQNIYIPGNEKLQIIDLCKGNCNECAGINIIKINKTDYKCLNTCKILVLENEKTLIEK